MLTPAQMAQWQADGYVVLPHFKPPTEIQAAVARAHALVQAFEPQPGTSRFSTRDRSKLSDAALLASAEAVHAFFEEEALADDGTLRVPKDQSINKIGHALHDRDPFFEPFSHGPAWQALAQQLGLAQPLVWQSQLIFKQPRIGGEVGWHQDATFLATTPQTVTTFWLALEDATLDNGCLWVLPGGQHSPLRERYTCEDGRLTMEALSDLPWPRDEDAVPLPVPAGTLVCFNGLMPHASPPNRSGRSRLAYTLHATCASATYSPGNWLQRSDRLPVRGFV